MITHRQAAKLLPPGDTVFCTNGKSIVRARVIKVEMDHLLTDEDVLFFEDHGKLWWLTEKEATKVITGTR